MSDSWFVLGCEKMADGSTIEWTDATWNPVTGCTKITRGCDHCYAERFAERFRGVPGHPFATRFAPPPRPETLGQPPEVAPPAHDLGQFDERPLHKSVPREFID